MPSRLFRASGSLFSAADGASDKTTNDETTNALGPFLQLLDSLLGLLRQPLHPLLGLDRLLRPHRTRRRVVRRVCSLAAPPYDRLTHRLGVSNRGAAAPLPCEARLPLHARGPNAAGAGVSFRVRREERRRLARKNRKGFRSLLGFPELEEGLEEEGAAAVPLRAHLRTRAGGCGGSARGCPADAHAGWAAVAREWPTRGPRRTAATESPQRRRTRSAAPPAEQRRRWWWWWWQWRQKGRQWHAVGLVVLVAQRL